MTIEELESLKKDLIYMAKNYNMEWGSVQNNKMDSLSNKIFEWKSLDEMESYLCHETNEKNKNYVRRQWFVYESAQCDEFFFQKNGAEPNSNKKDKNWDFKINGIKFDHKGTKLPKDLTYSQFKTDPEYVINWLYEHQSKEQRYGEQNRPFIIHISLVDRNRDDLLRCPLPKKEEAIKNFIDNFNDVKLFNYKNAVATFLVIEESQPGKMSYWFPKIR